MYISILKEHGYSFCLINKDMNTLGMYLSLIRSMNTLHRYVTIIDKEYRYVYSRYVSMDKKYGYLKYVFSYC